MNTDEIKEMLKPCQFCGSKATIAYDYDILLAARKTGIENPYIWMLYCSKAGCFLHYGLQQFKRREITHDEVKWDELSSLVEWWNTRSDIGQQL